MPVLRNLISLPFKNMKSLGIFLVSIFLISKHLYIIIEMFHLINRLYQLHTEVITIVGTEVEVVLW